MQLAMIKFLCKGLIYTILSLSIFTCFGQDIEKSKVGDTGYELILNTLLSHTVPEMNVTTLKDNLETYVLLDAREEEEFSVSHIPNAKYIGYDYFTSDSLAKIDKSQPIVVYCSVGYRSEKISEKLQKLGYKEVYNLYGGIFEWVNQGNAVVSGELGETTEQVHAYDRVWGTWLKKGEKVY